LHFIQLSFCKNFGEQVGNATDQWKKNDQPDPITLVAFFDAMNNTNELESYCNIINVWAEEGHVHLVMVIQKYKSRWYFNKMDRLKLHRKK